MFKTALVASILFAGLAANARAVTIDTVPVGNVGDGHDPLTGNYYGGVNYDYNIGTAEPEFSKTVDKVFRRVWIGRKLCISK